MDKKTTLQLKAIRSLYPSFFARYDFNDSELLSFVNHCPDFSYRLFLLENCVNALNYFRKYIIPKGDKNCLDRYNNMAKDLFDFVFSMTDGIWLPF